MPGLDGTGPMGYGPMTGRGFGICNRANAARYVWGLGPGIRRGFARGFGRGFYFQPEASVSDKDFLEKQKEFLESQLKAIKDELDNLEG
jgi:hypothetical protein